LEYSYDADGHVIGKSGSLARTNLPSTVTGNSFNAANAMTAFGPQTLSYDANGNLTNDGTNTYTWDARNHLNAITGGSTASFQYDPFGRRTQKTISGVTTQFLYDGLNPVQELDGSSPANVTANLLTGTGIDQYFTRTDAAGTRNLLTDTLGSTIALADSAGALQTQYGYDPFGNATVTGASSANPYRFTGRENDGTGLYYYRARYYHSTFQRFVSQDLIQYASGGANLYNYVHNDPINFSDLLGFQATPTPGPVPSPLPNPIPPSPSPGPVPSPAPSPTPPPNLPPWVKCLATDACLCIGEAGCGLVCGGELWENPAAYGPCNLACPLNVEMVCHNIWSCP